MPSTPQPLPETLTLIAYDDPVIETHGHYPTSAYVDWCWTPIIGPSSVALYRRLAALVATDPGPGSLRVDTVDLVASIGLGAGLARHGIAARTISRLAAFDVIRRNGDTIAVRRALPNHTAARANRLPRLSRCVHDRLTARPAGTRP